MFCITLPATAEPGLRPGCLDLKPQRGKVGSSRVGVGHSCLSSPSLTWISDQLPILSEEGGDGGGKRRRDLFLQEEKSLLLEQGPRPEISLMTHPECPHSGLFQDTFFAHVLQDNSPVVSQPWAPLCGCTGCVLSGHTPIRV